MFSFQYIFPFNFYAKNTSDDIITKEEPGTKMNIFVDRSILSVSQNCKNGYALDAKGRCRRVL